MSTSLVWKKKKPTRGLSQILVEIIEGDKKFMIAFIFPLLPSISVNFRKGLT
jgi:hypothetical protein